MHNQLVSLIISFIAGDGLVVRRCWVNFQCQGVLLTWITVGQGPIVLSVGAGGGCLDIFSLIYHFSFLSPSLWETAGYRLKQSQRAVKPQNNQPTKYFIAPVRMDRKSYYTTLGMGGGVGVGVGLSKI